MKKIFPGYFNYNQEQIKSIWDGCIFVFDANILLNLYRYSENTRNEFLKIIDKIKHRICLPHRAAEEFFINRLNVIGQQEKAYDTTINSIDSLKTDLDNVRQHPFVSSNTMNKVNDAFELLKIELKENKQKHTNQINNDELKESISLLFKDKVSKAYSKDKLEEIFKEGEERYKERIPPGYSDEGKIKDAQLFSEKSRIYGDLIVWKQVIDISKENDKSIIFVTDDRKIDWWEKYNGQTIGPRPELISEFVEITSNLFQMYRADRFLELSRVNLNEDVSDEMVNEIRELRRKEKQSFLKKREIDNYLMNKECLNELNHIYTHLQKKLKYYQEELEMLKVKSIQKEIEFKSLSNFHDENKLNSPAETIGLLEKSRYYDIEKDEIKFRMVDLEFKINDIKDEIARIEINKTNL